MAQIVNESLTTDPKANKDIVHRSGHCPGSAAIAIDLQECISM